MYVVLEANNSTYRFVNGICSVLCVPDIKTVSIKLAKTID